MIVYGDLVGAKNGSNVNFTIPATLIGSVLIIFNTSSLFQVGSSPGPTQCIRSGVNITLGVAPNIDANLMYYGDDAMSMHHGNLIGVKNSINTSFTLPELLIPSSTLIILNTSILYPVASSPGPTQCILSGVNVTVGYPPASTDSLWYYGEPEGEAIVIENAVLAPDGSFVKSPSGDSVVFS